MGISSTILGGGASAVFDSVGGVLDNLFTSDEEREEIKRLRNLRTENRRNLEIEGGTISFSGQNPRPQTVAPKEKIELCPQI